MESQAPDVTSTCLICFETRALKIVGNCKHSFCKECLSTVLGSLESGSEVFACPSCKVDCPLPWDGVNGMVDYTGTTVEAVDASIKSEDVPEENEKGRKGQENSESTTGAVICDLCNHKHKKVPAANICSDCYHLHICKNCTKNHRKNKATQAHTLTPIATKCWEKEVMCLAHQKLLLNFCKTCSEPICILCVSFDHGDHDIEKLADTIQSNVEVVRRMLGSRQVKLAEMQDLEKELTILKAMARVVDKKDTLIKEIEDHAQKWIDQIVKFKEDLKTQAEVKFTIIQDIPVGLEKVSDAVKKQQEPIHRATELLSKTEHHPAFVKKLKIIQQDLEATATGGDEIEKKEYRAQLVELRRNNFCFDPHSLVSNFGGIYKSPVFDSTPRRNIFEHTMKVDSHDMFIPCVASLGPKYFAVAHPVKPGELSKAIDIYEFTGTLKRTLRDQVPPLYDMSSTPDGKLAVLSGSTNNSNCAVLVFDPESGNIRSTSEIDIYKPLALGVTILQQFVILGENEMGQKQLTVWNTDGSKEYDYIIDEGRDSAKNPNNVTCGGSLIFVKGEKTVTVYMLKVTGLQRVTEDSLMKIQCLMDISATPWEDLFVAKSYSNRFYQEKYQPNQDQKKWQREGWGEVVEKGGKKDREVRISTSDGHITVVSHDQTIKVYEWD